MIWVRRLKKAYNREDWAKVERILHRKPSLLGVATTAVLGMSMRHARVGDCPSGCGCETVWQLLRRAYEAHPEGVASANPRSLMLVGMVPDQRRSWVRAIALDDQSLLGSPEFDAVRQNPYVAFHWSDAGEVGI